VSLCDIDRHELLVWACKNGFCGRAALEEKRQPMLLAGRSRFDWKTKCQQAVEEPPFGRFETCPCQLRLRSVDIGDHVVERTRETEWALTVDRDRAVAHIVANIGWYEPGGMAI